MTPSTIRAAAIQFEAELGNVDHNLEASERWATAAATGGADWIVLPEFFSTGVAYRPELAQNAPPAEGPPTRLLQDLARRYGVHVGGSTLVRDQDGHVRNAFFLAGPNGELLGRHDKDMPTMWESALYVGGVDPGRIDAGPVTAGVALCWELLRTQTLARLGGRVDIVLSGSGWWSIPSWRPRRFTAWQQQRNERRALAAPRVFARAVGAPLVHAAHSGALDCPWPLGGVTYHGHYAGGAMVVDAHGATLAFRGRDDGPGVAIANVRLERREPIPTPDRFWLQRRGTIAAACWDYQNPLGRRQYARSVAQRSLA